MVEKMNTPNEKSPVEEQDSKNEDDEFKRIELEQKLKPSSSNDKVENTFVTNNKSRNQ